jgi:hypothetical protein
MSETTDNSRAGEANDRRPAVSLVLLLPLTGRLTRSMLHVPPIDEFCAETTTPGRFAR